MGRQAPAVQIKQKPSSRWARRLARWARARRLAESGQRQALSHWSSLDLTFLAFRWATVWLAGRGARRLAELGASPGAWPLGRRSGRKSNKALGELRASLGERWCAWRKWRCSQAVWCRVVSSWTSWKENLHYLALNTRP